MTLGERVLILRRRRQLSQRGLAKVADVSFATIAKLEQGGLHDLSGEYIVKLARALGVTADILLGMAELDTELADTPTPPEQPKLTPRQQMRKATSVG
jgi:transcriptional regulator with XRE-family HTH domain